MILVDAHQDIAYNALTFGRDYHKSALLIRRAEAHEPALMQAAGAATLGLPEALLGRVGVVCATIFALPLEVKTPAWETLAYRTPLEAYHAGLRQMDYYHRLADETSHVRLVSTQADLDAVLATWQPDHEIGQHQQGMVLLMEGADPIIAPQQFEEWYGRGVRAVGLAWHATRYAAGTGQPGRLTMLGHELLEALAAFNVLLDVSHLAEEAYFEALDVYQGQAVFASHSNPRRFCNTDRHLSDQMILRLAERDGVMGIVLLNSFLQQTWRKGDPKSTVTLGRVVEAVDYVCQLTGSAAHVGIGSDLDGGFGAESAPQGIDTAADLWNIGGALREKGYQEEDIAAIMSGNMLRKLRQSLPL